MKKVITLLTVIALIMVQMVTMSIPVTADDVITPASVMVNNSVLNPNVPSVSFNGTMLSPANELVSALGGSFSFDQNSYSYLTSKITLNENEIILQLDSSNAQVNGKNITMPAPMKIIKNRIMVPAKFISETLGANTFINTKNGALMIFQPQNNNIVYSVQSGDSLWRISTIFGSTVDFIRAQNNLTSDILYIGQKLIVKAYVSAAPKISGITSTNANLRTAPSTLSTIITTLPAATSFNIIGKSGNWYKANTSRGIGYISGSVSSVVQDISYAPVASNYFTSKIQMDTTNDTVAYTQYIVVSGDNVWNIALKFGIPDYELKSANNLTSTSVLSIGQVLNVPVHNIALHQGLNGLETMDWFSQANYIFPIGKVIKFTDIQTGKSFMAQRTMGANHSDTETLTSADTAIMKDIFGGSWTWNRRPFILEVDGRRIAVSVAGMPHAGVDGVPYNQMVDNRSDNYGYGPNLDTISGNGMDGHFDVYTFNGLRHKDNMIDSLHQLSVSLAAGLR